MITALRDITPVLEPLAAFKDRILVLSGLANNEARNLEFEKSPEMVKLLVEDSPP